MQHNLKWKRMRAGRYVSGYGVLRYVIQKTAPRLWEVYAGIKTVQYVGNRDTLRDAKILAEYRNLRLREDNTFVLSGSMHATGAVIHKRVYALIMTPSGSVLYRADVCRLKQDIADENNPEAFRQLLSVARDAAIDAGYLPQEG